MLVLSRKPDQTIVIGSDIVVTVMSVRSQRVKIGIQAPSDVRILRQELDPTIEASGGESDSQRTMTAYDLSTSPEMV